MACPHRGWVTVGWFLALISASGCDDPAQPEPLITVLAIAPDTLRVDDGTVAGLTLDVRDSLDRPLHGRVSVTWSSSNEGVATVDADGFVTGRHVGGPVTITADAGGRSASAIVLVTPRVLTIEPREEVLGVGETLAFTVEALDQHLVSVGTGATQWISRAPTIAMVDPASGVVTGTSPGKTTIEATVHGKTVSASIHVSVPSQYDGVWVGNTQGITFEIRLGFVTSFRMTGYTALPIPNGEPGGTCTSEFEENPFAALSGLFVIFDFTELGGTLAGPLSPSGVSAVLISFEPDVGDVASGRVYLSRPLKCPAINGSIVGITSEVLFEAQRQP